MTENFVSTDPLVDGSGLTTNPEIKLRRKRVLSESGQIAPGRPVKIAEFVNACRFLAGDTDKPFPLSLTHSNILSLIRNGHDVPENYESVINSNLDIVLKAAALKPAEVKSKYFTANYITNKKNEPKVGTFTDRLENWSKAKQCVSNPITTKANTIIVQKENDSMTNSKRKLIYNDEQTKKDFMQYLLYRIDKADMPDTTRNAKKVFMQNIGSYLRQQFTFCNKALRAIMDENPDIMNELSCRRQTKYSKLLEPKEAKVVLRDTAKDKKLNQIDAKSETCELLPSQTITATKLNTKVQTETFIEFIKALKDSGLTEIILKF